MSVELRITLRSGRVIQLSENEIAELGDTLQKLRESFTRHSDMNSEHLYDPEIRGVLRPSVAPTFKSVLDFIRSKPNYEHSQTELEYAFYKTELSTRGNTAEQWSKLYHLARRARQALTEHEKVKWVTKKRPNGHGNRKRTVYSVEKTPELKVTSSLSSS
jgi:hypothetical protein